MVGTVKSFNREKFYGFIEYRVRLGNSKKSSFQTDTIFFHGSSVETDKPDILIKTGDTVEFEIGSGKKGEQANHVCPILDYMW